jgi:hypothetical protein
MQGRADANRETSKGAVLATAPFFLDLAKFIARELCDDLRDLVQRTHREWGGGHEGDEQGVEFRDGRLSGGFEALADGLGGLRVHDVRLRA